VKKAVRRAIGQQPALDLTPAAIGLRARSNVRRALVRGDGAHR
jgi:hypothetical protein